jgi:hypothetical protein
VINSFALTGQGVGTVIKLVEVKIARRPGTPGGAFESAHRLLGNSTPAVLVTVHDFGYRQAGSASGTGPEIPRQGRCRALPMSGVTASSDRLQRLCQQDREVRTDRP